MGTRPKGKRQLTRRGMLKTGASALGGGALLLGGGSLDVAAAAQAQAPAIATGTQTGRTFRGLVRHDATLDVQEMQLLPIDSRQVVIRSLAVGEMTLGSWFGVARRSADPEDAMPFMVRVE